MVYETYNQLQQEKQMDLLMKRGVLLVECRRFNLRLRLFGLDNFYVEIYSTEETGEVIAVNAFDDLSTLDTYLEKIDISELV